ncbi:methionine ABC transporter ATP-binding protein [Blastochloris viridis]|uniref:Cell division ATP-binding protein FtsE n=1 Tax=Blastochloris viridis TaxID=1079 RepID=A0A0H5BDZ3_BLAVI|nr:methionine ABC transporter ATP-binding protein [Blastochloris viridis]ALK08163.1 Methionine import ATP-binding protein MetN [Blastochloris viridis]BAR98571.1 methionine ABC transporter ATP-binding protein [Blastochloris viridis]CUU44085.1 Methionine import ATP-binding protein MetN [Blastochloris viridis]
MNAHTTAVLRADDAVPLPEPRPPVIRLDRVGKIYRPRGNAEPVTALHDISIDVGAGEILGIIGRSGAGKSTLVRIVNALERPTAGRVELDGVVLSELPEAAARTARRSIGMVFQHFALLARRTAADNVALALEIAGWARRDIAPRVDELLDLVGLEAQRDRYPSELSGGQKQRVGIARALAVRPKVLLCDEATSALDPETTQQILSLIARIRRELHLTVVLITHEMNVVKSIADRVAVLDQGRVVEQGSTFEVFAHPRHDTTKSFVGSVTGSLVSDELRARLQPEPVAGGRTVLRIVFTGPNADEPVLSRVTRLLGIDVNILAGQIDPIAGRSFGTLIVAVPGEPVTVEAVRAALARLNLSTEILGHVA